MALTRLDRPIGIWLLMWPMLWAFWFAAGGPPSLDILLIFLVGTVLTRSAGCAINDYADRNFDAHVERTRYRPLATGEITPREALIVAALLMLMAFCLVLLTNRITILMSFVALLLAALYPFAKRFTDLPQLVLGLAFSWAIPMAYAAQTGTVTRDAWLVFLASVLWAIAYDTMYAMFHSGLIIALFLVIYQLVLIRKREPSRCIQAFLNNHYLGMIVFIGIVLDYALAHPGKFSDLTEILGSIS